MLINEAALSTVSTNAKKLLINDDRLHQKGAFLERIGTLIKEA